MKSPGENLQVGAESDQNFSGFCSDPVVPLVGGWF